MLTTTQLLLVTLVALYKYGVLLVSADYANDYQESIFSPGEDKRSYIFDKEKRPRYDFGIGKRSLNGNRQKMYAFGLGKRNDESISDYDQFLEELYGDKSDKKQHLAKRDANRQRMYAFGLGKRQMLSPNDYDEFLDDLYNGEKQDVEKSKDFWHDENKRPHFDMGVGKRDSNRQRMYAFGLGKRDSTDDYDFSDLDLVGDYTKRLQPYGFGLGKRSPAPYNFGLGKRILNQYGISQRSQRYNFGLGKRSAYDDDIDGQYLRYLDAKRSRYNFGLGKRNGNTFGELVPFNQHELYTRASQKFNFGLGKREVSKEELHQLEESSPTASSSLADRSSQLEEADSQLAGIGEPISSQSQKRQSPTTNVDTFNLQEMTKH